MPFCWALAFRRVLQKEGVVVEISPSESQVGHAGKLLGDFPALFQRDGPEPSIGYQRSDAFEDLGHIEGGPVQSALGSPIPPFRTLVFSPSGVMRQTIPSTLGPMLKRFVGPKSAMRMSRSPMGASPRLEKSSVTRSTLPSIPTLQRAEFPATKRVPPPYLESTVGRKIVRLSNPKQRVDRPTVRTRGSL